MELNKNDVKSKHFNWDNLTKTELIHFLHLTENMGYLTELMKVDNEIQFGNNICIECTKIYKKGNKRYK